MVPAVRQQVAEEEIVAHHELTAAEREDEDEGGEAGHSAVLSLPQFMTLYFRKSPMRAATSQFALSTPEVVQCSPPRSPTALAMIITCE